MTTINISLKDSLGAALVGKVVVKLDYLVTDSSNNAYLPVTATATLVNGACTLNLTPSDLSKITYLFEIYQSVSVASVTTDTLVWSFRAMVPYSATAIALTDLIPTTGITKDAWDSSLLTVIRRLVASTDFWDRLRDEVLEPRGVYSAGATYRLGDVVTHSGSSYWYTNQTQTSGNAPPNTTYWQLLAS